MESPVLFALAVFTVLSTPGPTNALLATSGAAIGVRRSLLLIPAEMAGYTISILTIGLALGPIVASGPVLAGALRAAVGCYLLWLALSLWRCRSGGEADIALVKPGQVFITTLLNPKAIIFALAVVPFGAGHCKWLPYFFAFLLFLILISSAWIAGGAIVGRTANRKGWSGMVPRMGAVAVAGFALILLVGPLLS